MMTTKLFTDVRRPWFWEAPASFRGEAGTAGVSNS